MHLQRVNTKRRSEIVFYNDCLMRNLLTVRCQANLFWSWTSQVTKGVQDTYQLPKISSISKSIIFLKMTLCILQRHTIPIDKWEFLVTLSKIQFLKKENLLFGSWASPLSQGGSHFSTWMSWSFPARRQIIWLVPKLWYLSDVSTSKEQDHLIEDDILIQPRTFSPYACSIQPHCSLMFTYLIFVTGAMGIPV